MPEGENREIGTEDIWNNNEWEFPKINVRHQTTHAGSSKKRKRGLIPKNLYQGISYSKCKRQRQKRNLERSQRRKKDLTHRQAKVRITLNFFSSKVMQTRREWSKIFKMLKEKKNQPI